ncbi:MAG TPA: hypothetical protein PLV13_01735 [Ilumatobacteraceae bacterium]|nr:hypothetical protein [Ilumatobacteraceae bacterium]
MIADDINRRWVTVENGVPSVTPYVDGLVPVAQPQADGLGRIFVVWMVMPSSGSSTGVLQVFADGNLANPIATVAAESATVYSELRLAADGVHVNWPLVADAPMPVLTPGPAVEVDSEKGQVLTAWQGVSRVWQFPEGSPVYALGPSPSLSDGSVVVWMADDPTAANPHWLWLRADGSAVAIPTPVSAPTEGDAVYVTPDGLVQLEYNSGRFEVARYSLPK